MRELLKKLKIDYLLVNSTNEYLVEYSSLSENARHTLTGFTGSTGDALVTKDKIYLFVDGRYHIQTEQEAFSNITVIKLQLGQKQDDEIRKLIDKKKTLGVVAKKVSQARLETFNDYKIKLLNKDPINNYTEHHNASYTKAFLQKEFSSDKPMFISNLEEVSYLTGYRDFSENYSSKIWAKLIVKDGDYILFTDNKACEEYLKNFKNELYVDKNSINAYDYALIRKPIHKISPIKKLKAIKSDEELDAYKKAFRQTDKTMMAIRKYIESHNNLSEYDITTKLEELFFKYGAKSLSFNSIVAINQNSALAHYSKSAKDVILNEGDLVLIDCGAYYETGLATDITRVFVKGKPTKLHKKVYTMVLKAFLNCFNFYNTPSGLRPPSPTREGFLAGYEIDKLAHQILDESIEGFAFSHGLGHGIGINVHEAPPALNQGEIAKEQIEDGMCFTIEPGLYNSNHFGVRLENSCYKKDGKIHSFVKMGYEGKLIDHRLLTKQEKKWLKDFKILWK